MTPKERVLAATQHEEPDRVPIGEWGFGPEVARPVLGDECLWLGGLSRNQAFWDGRRDQLIQQWKTGLVRLAEFYEWDAILLHLVIGSDTHIDVPESLTHDTWRCEDGAVITHSRETDRLFITERGEPRPTPAPAPPRSDEPTASELDVIRHVAQELGDTHFLFSAALSGHPQLRYSDASVSEVEQWVKLYEDPEAFLETRLAYLQRPEVARSIARVQREGLGGVAYGWDFGCNHGPFMSPELFRRYIMPYLAGFCALVHEQGLLMLLHSCGNNQLLMDLIVEAGVDIYQSIQTEMDIIKMKTRYGDRITLWGGVPAGDLVLGKPDEIRATGRAYLRACKPGGGYIYGTTHSIMPAAKYENYQAMLDAWRECGTYASS